VATEFHQEVLGWLFRDVTVVERELGFVHALERKLADMLLLACENDLRPWWYRAREAASSWRTTALLDLEPAPKGFLVDGGLWRSSSGAESALSPLGARTEQKLSMPRSIERQDLAWVALPAGVNTVEYGAFRDCSGLTLLRIPSSFEGCSLSMVAQTRCKG
jgi:hypothetical protein